MNGSGKGWLYDLVAAQWIDDVVRLLSDILIFFCTWLLKRALVSFCFRDAHSKSLYVATPGAHLISTVHKQSQHTRQRNDTEQENSFPVYGCIKWLFCGHSSISVAELEPGLTFPESYSSILITRLSFFLSDVVPVQGIISVL